MYWTKYLFYIFFISLWVCPSISWAQIDDIKRFNKSSDHSYDTNSYENDSYKNSYNNSYDNRYNRDNNRNNGDKEGLGFKSLRPKKKKDSITFTANDYKIITYLRDTTVIDTSISMAKYYRNNAWQKDLFGKMPMGNMAQPYNSLSYDFRRRAYLPDMGATAKKQLYLTPEEITYYYIPTPVSQFSYKTGMEQGQNLDVLFSANLTPQFNFFIAYRGLRSLGKYRRALVSNGNFRTGFSYVSANKKYTIFTHYATNDTYSQENGGIVTLSQFEGGERVFKNRATININLLDAENNRESKRFFLQHDYALLRTSDSLKTNKQLRFRHLFSYEKEHYNFKQSRSNSFLGDAFVSESLLDSVNLRKMTNKLGVEVELPYLGKTFLFANAYHYNYFFPNAYYVSGVLQRRQIKDTDMSLGVEWHKKVKGFSIDAQGEQTFIGKMTGTHLAATLAYAFNTENKLSAGMTLHSAMPNFNFLLYQSDYKRFNWNNYDSFQKENYQTLYGSVRTQWGEAHLDITNINNYTYFASEGRGIVRPQQYSGNIQYLQLKLYKDIRVGKFGLDNTILYQQVVQDSKVLNVPTIVTRNSLYIKTPMFQRAMILQAGIGLNYFTKYYANEYNPLLGEYATQTERKIGNFPALDLFINAKVRTMRIFFSLEQWQVPISNISWMPLGNPYRYYSTPTQPYRDFILRLGINWNLFN